MRKVLLAPIILTWFEPVKTVFSVTMLCVYDSLSTLFLLAILIFLYG